MTFFSPSYFSVLLKPARGLFTKVELYHRINQRRELVLTFLRQGWHGWGGPFAWPFACSMDELPKTAVRHSYQLREFHGDITCSVNSRGAILCIYIYISYVQCSTVSQWSNIWAMIMYDQMFTQGSLAWKSNMLQVWSLPISRVWTLTFAAPWN